MFRLASSSARLEMSVVAPSTRKAPVMEKPRSGATLDRAAARTSGWD
jgi:hypothetical protein